MKALLFFAFSVATYAQPYVLGVQYTNVDPSPTCTIRSILVSNELNHKLWQCQSGTYVNIGSGSGSGGTVTSVGFSTNLGTVTGSPVTTAGTLTNTVSAAQVVGLFSACSGTLYLGADGACHAISSARTFGANFTNGGNALGSGYVTYFTFPFGCTIAAWNITISPADTATFDIWKIATGTAIPTVANTIVAAAAPAIASGTAIHSTTLTAWTTTVSANDIFGIKLQAVGGTATQATLNVECN